MYEENLEGILRLAAMLPSRIIEVSKLKKGDIVQPNKEPQTVEFVRVLEDKNAVLLRLSGEETRRVHAGFVYKLIRRSGENPDGV